MTSTPLLRSPSPCLLGVWAAAATLVGILLSGPLALVLVNRTHPQPSWTSAEVFARSYHPIQSAPFLGGIILVAALVVLISSVHAVAQDQRALTTTALVFASVFATLIFFNYVVQTTFLPALARSYQTTDAAIVSALTMSNPKSLAWGIELWGWGFLGVATWLLAPVFQGSALERATALAFIANGPVSLLGAVWTVARPGWVITPAGLAAFGMWNVLLAVMAVLALLAFRARMRDSATERVERAPARSPGSSTAR
jgi:hypothetical protein